MISKNIYKYFADMIQKETGIMYGEGDYDRLKHRIEKLKDFAKVNTYEELLDYFKKGPSNEMQSLLISTSTNNETSFFRDKKIFDILLNHIVPEIRKSKTTSVLKIWSAAASTGQEAYSVLMRLQDGLSDFDKMQITLKGTDISKEALSKCQSGIYDMPEIQRGLPTIYLIKFFDQIAETRWVVKPSIKKHVQFSEFNLLTGNYPKEEYDIIFCRNVLIYQSVENKEIILRKMYESLRAGGFLILGAAENTIGLKTLFKANAIDGYMFYRKE